MTEVYQATRTRDIISQERKNEAVGLATGGTIVTLRTENGNGQITGEFKPEPKQTPSHTAFSEGNSTFIPGPDPRKVYAHDPNKLLDAYDGLMQEACTYPPTVANAMKQRANQIWNALEDLTRPRWEQTRLAK